MRTVALLLAALAATLGSIGVAVQFLHPAPPPPPASLPAAQAPPDAFAGPAEKRTLLQALRAARPGPSLDERLQKRLAPGGAPDPARNESPLPELSAPRRFRAVPEPSGIRLSWEKHPANPVEGLSYRIWRWTGAGGPEEIARTDSLELLDPVRCEGVVHHYRLRAVVERTILDGQRIERESPPAAARAELPRTAAWSVVGRTTGAPGEERLRLLLRRPGRPELGPFEVGPGEEFGDSGWYLEELRFRETEVLVQTRIPRFDALGRRVIIGGRPADRVREESVTRPLALVRLTDPCGSRWDLELLVDPPSSAAQHR